ncbi:MAG: hypothetical protein ACK559_22075, partial [bacterium]
QVAHIRLPHLRRVRGRSGADVEQRVELLVLGLREGRQAVELQRQREALHLGPVFGVVGEAVALRPDGAGVADGVVDVVHHGGGDRGLPSGEGQVPPAAELGR